MYIYVNVGKNTRDTLVKTVLDYRTNGYRTAWPQAQRHAAYERPRGIRASGASLLRIVGQNFAKVQKWNRGR